MRFERSAILVLSFEFGLQFLNEELKAAYLVAQFLHFPRGLNWRSIDRRFRAWLCSRGGGESWRRWSDWSGYESLSRTWLRRDGWNLRSRCTGNSCSLRIKEAV